MRIVTYLQFDIPRSATSNKGQLQRKFVHSWTRQGRGRRPIVKGSQFQSLQLHFLDNMYFQHTASQFFVKSQQQLVPSHFALPLRCSRYKMFLFFIGLLLNATKLRNLLLYIISFGLFVCNAQFMNVMSPLPKGL